MHCTLNNTIQSIADGIDEIEEENWNNIGEKCEGILQLSAVLLVTARENKNSQN